MQLAFLTCPWDGLTPSEAKGITAIFTLIAARLNAFPPRFYFPSSTCQHSQISWLKCDKDIGGCFDLPGGIQCQNPSVVSLIDCIKTNKWHFFNHIFGDQSLIRKTCYNNVCHLGLAGALEFAKHVKKLSVYIYDPLTSSGTACTLKFKRSTVSSCVDLPRW